MQFQDRTIVAPNLVPALIPPPPANFAFTHNDSIWVARTGLSWRFGGGPVYAKY